MKTKKYYYLLKLQFLGFRYHGWQKQPQLKTVQGMLDKTLSFILGHQNFKTLGASRTDAMVSANAHLCQVFTHEALNPSDFLVKLNQNLPSDIKALSFKEVGHKFQIIGHTKHKEYLYLFSHGQKAHPFAASLMTTFRESLDIELMKQGAKLFEGEHFFHHYIYQPSPHGHIQRKITTCEILENNIYTANFFPTPSYYLRVCGKGFGRYQIRLMMGTLLHLGRHQISLEDIKYSLKENSSHSVQFAAPQSGLILYELNHDDE